MTPATNDIEVGALPPGESTPLVAFHDPDDPDALGEVENCTKKEIVISAVAAVASAASLAAMIVEGNPMVYVSGTTGLVVAPYSAFQQQKITDTEALEETNERMELEVNNLKVENDRLQSSVGELEKSVDNLRELEDTLKIIKKSETKSIDKLEKQLDEQKEILASMKGNLKATIMQNLISVTLNCDTDGDMTLSDDEIDLLIQKVQNLHGVDLKDDLFRAMIIGCGRSIQGVMEVIRNLMDDDVPEEDRLFNLTEKDREDFV